MEAGIQFELWMLIYSHLLQCRADQQVHTIILSHRRNCREISVGIFGTWQVQKCRGVSVEPIASVRFYKACNTTSQVNILNKMHFFFLVWVQWKYCYSLVSVVNFLPGYDILSLRKIP
jgi:hypothetical protein